MYVESLIFYSLTILLCSVQVESQICNKMAIVTSTTRLPYTQTYREQYQTKTWLGRKTTKTRIGSYVAYRTVSTRQLKTVQTCCYGYIRDDNSSDDNIVCLPVCFPSCKNGYCDRPGECACSLGYFKDPTNGNNCLPRCPLGCNNGSCVAPNKCECNFGYEDSGGQCKPICSEPCVNGTCTAPDTCECYNGFRKSENNICEPYCSKGCGANGVCIRPETCHCKDGFEMVDEECLPICTDPCNNGTCIAPNACECHAGFTLVNETCEPKCTVGCENGFCVAPDECGCNPGYDLIEGKCQPICREACDHGICTAPDTCQCEPGYKFNSSCDPVCCEPQCSKPCINGFCVEPEFCLCDLGYTKNFILDSCVPECSFDCGYGTCVAPETCKCHPGYAEKLSDGDSDNVHEPVCEPICYDCEGICIRPFYCICEGEISYARNETIDGQDCDCFENCSEPFKKCARTLCVLIPISTSETYFYDENGRTTSVDDKMYFYDYYNVESTTSSNKEIDVNEKTRTEEEIEITVKIHDTGKYFSTEKVHVITTDSNGSKDINIATTLTAGHKGAVIRTSSFWIYLAAAIILILITITVVIVVYRRKFLSYLHRGGSYVVEDKVEAVSSPPINLNIITTKKTT